MKKSGERIIRRIATVDRDVEHSVGASLKALREMAGFTQDQMARRLNVEKSVIHKMEEIGDIQIAALHRYVEALGAQLRVDAVFPSDASLKLYIKDVFNIEFLDDGQLILPIFDNNDSHQRRDVILSIKPRYCDKIFEGKKTVELRRRFPKLLVPGTVAYIYSTSPVMAIIGCAEITDVLNLSVSNIWKKYADRAFIEKRDFDAYFSGLSEGFALKFANARPLPRQFNLSELRERFDFEPPQSFLYVKPILRKALKNECTSVSS